MKRQLALAASLFLVSACAASGHYQGSGPCQGWHTDKEGCVRAHENSLSIGKVQIGQSTAQVRTIKGRDPERRNVVSGIEQWGFLTDYANELLTTVTFTNGTVSEIKQGPADQ